MKNFSDTIGNRTRDLPTCSAVPQPNAPPAACRLHRNNILVYIQQDATLHSLFYLETAPHVSGGTSTHHQERIRLYLQHLVFVRSLRSSISI